MQQSESIKGIASALAKAQGAMKAAPKDATNPHFKSRYADLASIWESIRAPLTSNGLSVLQSVLQTETGIAVQTQINHESGEWFRMDPCPIPVDKQNAQGAGSAITYGKRYSLAAAVGIVADDDDDGNEAAQRPPQQQYRPNGTQPRQAPPPKQEPAANPLDELTAKDQLIIAQCVTLFAETQSNADFMAVCDQLATTDSIIAKADHPELVKAQIKKAIKGHPNAPKGKAKQSDGGPEFVPEENQAA